MTTLDALVAEIEDQCRDWDGSKIPDAFETRTTIKCGKLRALLSALSELKAENDKLLRGLMGAAMFAKPDKAVLELKTRAEAAESAISQVTKERDEAREEVENLKEINRAKIVQYKEEFASPARAEGADLEVIRDTVDVLDGLNDDEINAELLPRLRAWLARAEGAVTVTEEMVEHMKRTLRNAVGQHWEIGESLPFDEMARAALEAALAIPAKEAKP